MSVTPIKNNSPKDAQRESVALIRRLKREVAEASGAREEGEGNWIVSYADMMTLLCVFFVLMYTMSKPDSKKMENFKRETVEYFGGNYKVPYSNLATKLKSIVAAAGLQKYVQINSDETGVIATFRGTVFFDSGQAKLLPQGMSIIEKMGAVIKSQASKFQIVVEGHTDDNPIVSPIFPSNWELSATRATRVIRMFEALGFPKDHLTAIGYADTRPVAPNRDAHGKPIPANQARNRRVVIRIIKMGAGVFQNEQKKPQK